MWLYSSSCNLLQSISCYAQLTALLFSFLLHDYSSKTLVTFNLLEWMLPDLQFKDLCQGTQLFHWYAVLLLQMSWLGQRRMSIQEEKSSPNICPALRNIITPKLKRSLGYGCITAFLIILLWITSGLLPTPPFQEKYTPFAAIPPRNTPFSPSHTLTDTKQQPVD